MDNAGIYCECGVKARSWLRLDPDKGCVLHAECKPCGKAEIAYKDADGKIIIEKEPQIMMSFM